MTEAQKSTQDLGDVVNATAVKERGGRKFDAEKVAKIKAQIANGEYNIDPARIVSKMIENNT